MQLELKCEIEPDPLDISEGRVAPYETKISESSDVSFTTQKFSGGIKSKVKYCCDFCNFESSFELIFEEHLMSHKKFKYNIAGYPCDHCSYITSSKSILKQHLKLNHDEMGHQCNQCDYTATLVGGLTRHKQSMHENRKYLCDHCDYAATRANNLLYTNNRSMRD